MARYATGRLDVAAAAPTTKDRYPALRGDGWASFWGVAPRGHRAPVRWPARASAPGPSGGSHAAGDRPASARARPAAAPRGHAPGPMHTVQCRWDRVPYSAPQPARRAPPVRPGCPGRAPAPTESAAGPRAPVG